MTQTFEEYLKANDVIDFKCVYCNGSCDYLLENSEGMCSKCIKKDYEENKNN